MRADYVWAVTSTWQRRHLATGLVSGNLPGAVGRAACGRSVMDYERAQHIWLADTPHAPAPRIEELLPCEVCTKHTGIVVTGPRGQRMPPGLAAYARRADKAEQEVRKDNELLREVMIMFGAGHNLSGRDPQHADCKVCQLLRRIRYRLASDDRVVTGT